VKSAERVARNDATFRKANDAIEASAEELGIEVVPFICECADEPCTELVLLQLEEYEAVRSDSTHFLNAVGHQTAAGPYGRVVERHDRYVVVEKLGRAAEIVEKLDERANLDV